jgi:RHS repeat-associated protein
VGAQDYYAFGMLMPGRTDGGAGRFGFNGKENVDEVEGRGNFQDYGMRAYDSRLGRFFSVDPLRKDYPWYSTYQFAGNKPIWATDLDGAEENKTNSEVEGSAYNNESTNKGIGKTIIEDAVQNSTTYSVSLSNKSNNSTPQGPSTPKFQFGGSDGASLEEVKKAENLVKEYKKNSQNALAFTIVGEILLESGVGGTAISKARKEVYSLFPSDDKHRKEAEDLYDKTVKLIKYTQKAGGMSKPISTTIGICFLVNAAELEFKNELVIAPNIYDLSPETGARNGILAPIGYDDFIINNGWGGGGSGGKW